LTPFRCPAAPRGPGDPQPLPHLDGPEHRAHGGLEISVEVHLSSKQMREAGLKPVRLSLGNFSDMYWTIGQFVTHHTSNGCNLRPGDLLGSGTISGPRRESRGCLLELTWDGDKETPKPGTQRTPLVLPTGEKRIFLADGDEVTLRGYAEGAGRRRIVLGECRGEVLPASGPEITGT
ncbi:MAG TPA: fumarylacetoacetate hydrolase family protein, partial [Pirellulaceae bacterium]